MKIPGLLRLQGIINMGTPPNRADEFGFYKGRFYHMRYRSDGYNFVNSWGNFRNHIYDLTTVCDQWEDGGYDYRICPQDWIIDDFTSTTFTGMVTNTCTFTMDKDCFDDF